jgi:hypothetical protein
VGGDWFSGKVREPRNGSRQYSWHVRPLKTEPVSFKESSLTNYTLSLRIINKKATKKHQINCVGNVKFVLQAA